MKKLFLLFAFMLGCLGQDLTDSDRIYLYNKICIEGHIYYNCAHQLAIKLNDDGTPVKCGK